MIIEVDRSFCLDRQVVESVFRTASRRDDPPRFFFAA